MTDRERLDQIVSMWATEPFWPDEDDAEADVRWMIGTMRRLLAVEEAARKLEEAARIIEVMLREPAASRTALAGLDEWRKDQT